MKFLTIFIIFFSSYAYSATKHTDVILLIPDKQGPLFWQLVSDISKAASLSLKVNLEIIYSNSNRFSLRHNIDEIVKRKKKPDYLIFRPFLGNTIIVFDQLEKNKIKFVTLERAFRKSL